MPYVGNPIPGDGFTFIDKQSFTGDGSTVNFTMRDPVGRAEIIEVYVGNVRQEPDVAYTVNGATLQFTGAPVLGERIYVINNNAPVRISIPADDSINAGKIKSNAVTEAKIINSAVTTNKIADNAVTGPKLARALAVTSNTTISGAVTTISSANTLLTGAHNNVVSANTVFQGHVLFEGTAKNVGTTTGFASATAVSTDAQQTFTKAQVPSTFGANSTTTLASVSGVLNFDDFQNFIVVLGNNSNTLDAPTTEASQIGQTGVIIFIQPGSGDAGTVSTHGDYETIGSGTLSLSSVNGQYDVVPYIIKADNSILLGTPSLNFG